MSAIIFDFDGTLVELSAQDPKGKTVCYLTSDVAQLVVGYMLTLVTASPTEEVKIVSRQTGIDQMLSFKEVFASEQGGNNKRTGVIFSDIQNRYGICVVIGDTDTDEEGAKNANCLFVRVNKMKDQESQSSELKRAVLQALSLLS